MQMLGIFVFKSAFSSSGFSLIELIVCLAVLAIFTSMAAPVWQPLMTRSQLEVARDELMNDVQTARVQALQIGIALKLVRLHGCAWASAESNDWSCGWRLQRQDTQEVLRTHAIHAPLQLLMANAKELSIGARGELGSVGTRWNLRGHVTSTELQYVVCLNSAGRLRWQTGAACS